MATSKKAQYAPPASQVDLEERLENGNRSLNILSTSDQFEKPEVNEGDGRDFRVEDNDTDGYMATAPEYATYANETEKPHFPDEGAENEVAAQFADSFQRFVDPVNRDTTPVEPPAAEQDEDDKSDEDSGSSSS